MLQKGIPALAWAVDSGWELQGRPAPLAFQVWPTFVIRAAEGRLTRPSRDQQCDPEDPGHPWARQPSPTCLGSSASVWDVRPHDAAFPGPFGRQPRSFGGLRRVCSRQCASVPPQSLGSQSWGPEDVASSFARRPPGHGARDATALKSP